MRYTVSSYCPGASGAAKERRCSACAPPTRTRLRASSSPSSSLPRTSHQPSSRPLTAARTAALAPLLKRFDCRTVTVASASDPATSAPLGATAHATLTSGSACTMRSAGPTAGRSSASPSASRTASAPLWTRSSTSSRSPAARFSNRETLLSVRPGRARRGWRSGHAPWHMPLERSMASSASLSSPWSPHTSTSACSTRGALSSTVLVSVR
mmetsp:Transcript_5017/g.12674  ORF Transcript_5017/g.12674 Transcript_5017/m.12674 type:complete len:211 (-) Transcript_5017:2791-3423(-)